MSPWTEKWRDKTESGVVVSTVTNGRRFETSVLGTGHDHRNIVAYCDGQAARMHCYLLAKELQREAWL